MTRKEADAILPSEPTQGEINPSLLSILLIGGVKFGKTTFAMSNPDCLHLGFEAGAKFIRGHKVVIDCWHKKGLPYKIWKDKEGVQHMTAMQALDLLKSSKKFSTACIDTADEMVRMCVEYHCEAAGAEHPSDMGDFGKGWEKARNKPIRKFVGGILKTGRGIIFCTHSKVETARFTSGEKARKEATLAGAPMEYISAQADLIIHGELGKRRPGQRKRDRIFVTEADADTMAGNRSGQALPERYIVSPSEPWGQFMKFFSDPEAAVKEETRYEKIYKGKKK